MYIENIMLVQKINLQNKKERRNVILNYDKFLYENYPNISYAQTKILHLNHYFSTQNHLKASSYNRKITYLRKFYDWLLVNGYHAKNLSLHLKFKKLPQNLPKSITLEQAIRLCDPLPDEINLLRENEIYARNQAIVEFLFSTGVRNSELREIRLADLSADLTSCVIFTKKGGNVRTVYLGSYARNALLNYLKIRQFSLDIEVLNAKNFKRTDFKKDNALLFCNLDCKAMYTQELNLCVKNLAIKRLGFSVNPHQIRHTFATVMLRATGCLSSVQKMLGHRKITSTEVYCDLELRDKKKALDLFHPRNAMRILK